MIDLVVRLGVGDVVQALIDHGHWADPADDLNPMELLNYTVQILDAKEISEEEITRLVQRPIIEGTCVVPEELDVPITGEDIWDMLTDESLDNEDTATDLYAVVGMLLEPEGNVNKIIDGLSEQGLDDIFNDTGHVNKTLVDYINSGDITLVDIFRYLSPAIGTMSPMDHHVNLMSDIYLETSPSFKLSVTDDLVKAIVKTYVDTFKPVAATKQTSTTYRYDLVFTKGGSKVTLTTENALDLASKLRDRGLCVFLEISPFSGIDDNRISISLASNYTYFDKPLVIEL